MNNYRHKNTYGFSSCPWTFKDVFIVFIYSIALFLVFCFWLSAIYLLMVLIGGRSFYPFTALIRHLQSSRQLYAVILFYLALFVAMKIKIFKKYDINIFKFFVIREHAKKDVFYGIVMYLKFLAIVLLSIILTILVATMWDMVFATRSFEHVNVFFTAYQHEKAVMFNEVTGVAGILILFVLAPFFEELFFRGCLYRALRISLPRFAAVFVSSFIFSFLHGYFFVFIYVFLIGLILAYMYEKRASLVAPLVFHMLNNILVVALFFL